MDIKQFIRIKPNSDHEDEILRVRKLAAELGLHPPGGTVGKVLFQLSYADGRLELTESLTEKHGKSRVFVDFLAGAARFRYKHDRSINQPLTKAVGIKQGHRPTICDTTAGYGTDSFIFASFGCVVTMIERSPIIWALLDDGLKRAAADRILGDKVIKNITLFRGNSIELLKKMDKKFETIYMDPMYPPRRSSALNKRKMRVLRSLVGDDADHAELLKCSMRYAKGRVVVKRPAHAPQIENQSVSYQVKGKRSRYDIYLTAHL